MLALDPPATKGSAMTTPTNPTSTTAPPGVLLAADVAALFTAERRKHEPDAKAYTATLILYYLTESRPDRRPNGNVRRYASHPMPKPRGHLGASRQVKWWSEDQKEDLLRWYRERPGQGHGRGGWPAGRPRRKG